MLLQNSTVGFAFLLTNIPADRQPQYQSRWIVIVLCSPLSVLRVKVLYLQNTLLPISEELVLVWCVLWVSYSTLLDIWLIVFRYTQVWRRQGNTQSQETKKPWEMRNKLSRRPYTTRYGCDTKRKTHKMPVGAKSKPRGIKWIRSISVSNASGAEMELVHYTSCSLFPRVTSN